LTRKEGKTKLSPQEELALLVGHLERHGYHPRTRDEYVVKDGVREKKVVRDIFFMSDDQIRMARRFVSGFIYETDATFNKSTCHHKRPTLAKNAKRVNFLHLLL
jgi:hypothetical protein